MKLIIIIIIGVISMIVGAVRKGSSINKDEYEEKYQPRKLSRFNDNISTYNPDRLGEVNVGLNNDGFKELVSRDAYSDEQNLHPKSSEFWSKVDMTSANREKNKAQMLPDPFGKMKGTKNMDEPTIIKKSYRLEKKNIKNFFDDLASINQKRKEEPIISPADFETKVVKEKTAPILSTPANIFSKEKPVPTPEPEKIISPPSPSPPPQTKPTGNVELSENTLLKTIQKFAGEGIYIEFGFFDNKFYVPLEIEAVFSATTEEIIALTKKLKQNGFLSNREETEIFSFPFRKKLVLSYLGKGKVEGEI